MKSVLTLAAALGALLWAASLEPAAAQDDVFAFIPDGGRSLLESARDAGLPPGLEAEIAANGGSFADWRARIEAAKSESAVLAGFDEWQTDTLAHYLASNAPLNVSGELPWDGRDMALQKCQSCHIITVVVTQGRTREAWLGTMHKPSHIEVELTEPEREALADYLVINAGIPIELVPPELRAGGASY